MERAAAIDILRANEAELRRRGVRHATLFGSVARGENHAGSDLDVMIEIDEEAVRDVYDYVGVIDFIGALFPMSVDVSNRNRLKEHVRPEAGTRRDPCFLGAAIALASVSSRIPRRRLNSSLAWTQKASNGIVERSTP